MRLQAAAVLDAGAAVPPETPAPVAASPCEGVDLDLDHLRDEPACRVTGATAPAVRKARTDVVTLPKALTATLEPRGLKLVPFQPRIDGAVRLTNVTSAPVELILPRLAPAIDVQLFARGKRVDDDRRCNPPVEASLPDAEDTFRVVIAPGGSARWSYTITRETTTADTGCAPRRGKDLGPGTYEVQVIGAAFGTKWFTTLVIQNE